MVKKCDSERSKSSTTTICSPQNTKEDKRAAALRANLRRRKEKTKSVKHNTTQTKADNKDE